MEQTPGKSRDRYDVSGSVEAEYVDADRTVLVNKRGVTGLASLQLLEEEALAQAYETLLGEIRVDTPMTCDLVRHVHRRIFGELYDWAGRWRTVWISKPGITWPAPDFIDENMHTWEREVLRKYPAASLGENDAFRVAVAEIQAEFLVIHPFREGNARTIKLLTDLLAAQTGRPPLVYDQSEEGKKRYVEAATAAFGKNYALMAEVIRRAMEPTGRQ